MSWRTFPGVWLGLTTSDWISIGGTAVALIGFGVTITQVVRVGRAVKEQQARTAGALLLARSGDLDRIENDLQTARSRHVAQRSVQEWRRAAADLQSILPQTELGAGFDRAPLQDSLKVSLGLVDVALTDLQDTSIPIQAACKPLLTEISKACGANRGLATAMMVRTT
jgi:hypothetical protein